MPVLRRIDDVLEGAPVVVGDRVVTPVARRRGWVIGARRGALFSLEARPHAMRIDSEGTSRLVRVPDWYRYASIAVALLATLVLVRRWRKPI